MKKFILALPLALGGCFYDLTPTQQANLQAEIALGKQVVQATTNIYCVFEPTTTKLIGIFDKSQNTNTMLTKIDAATAVICASALKSS